MGERLAPPLRECFVRPQFHRARNASAQQCARQPFDQPPSARLHVNVAGINSHMLEPASRALPRYVAKLSLINDLPYAIVPARLWSRQSHTHNAKMLAIRATQNNKPGKSV